ncbi:MAG: NAD-glutamate dehydrogenase, partial [Acetobacteraceae bacterium]|nr:NAD-glutamate dehydrogenase [Acetobacteraceae bacterium]
MRPHTEHDKSALIETVAGLAGASSGADPGFVRALYRNVAPEDLLPRTPENLLAAASSLWQFMQDRRPGRPKLRVVDPHAPATAWCAGRTVVQIVNDDMPFLVDSVTLALNARNFVVHLVIHPVLPVERTPTGHLVRLAPDSSGAPRESLMQVEVVGIVDEGIREDLAEELDAVLADVRAAVVDWELMKSRAERVAQEIGRSPVSAAEAAEIAAFLTWLADRNYTFLGYREYRIENESMSIVADSGLGVLRNEEFLVFDGLRHLQPASAILKQFVESSRILTISKSTRLSTVHRRVQMDTISVKTYSRAGEVNGQKLFVGLFTSDSYLRPAQFVPILRRKVANVIERSGFMPDSHDGKALQHILNSFPRDELFQFDEGELLTTAIGILNLQERQRIALFMRFDPFGRFVSCLVYVPRDRYSNAVRRRMGAILSKALSGTIVSESTHLDESVLARIHFVIGTTQGHLPEVDQASLERQLAEAGRTWADRLEQALSAAYPAYQAERLLRRYAGAFPGSYTEGTSPSTAVRDTARMERVLAGQPVGLSMAPGEGGALCLRTFHSGQPLALSDVLPMLENFGLRVITEIPFETHPNGVPRPLWVQNFELQAPHGFVLDHSAATRFEEAFALAWAGEIEDDGFNRLILLAGLTAEQAVVIRTYCKILRQAGSTFSQAYMEDTLARHAPAARKLFELFEVQFDPSWSGADREQAAAETTNEIEAALDNVSILDEDRILRSFLLLIQKSLRTNFYQLAADGDPKRYLSIKLASREIDLLPLPRPLVEVYVYSPRMEGCHLRGGRVARGGIRWSDRKEDFRAEILSLMKAQMVKNA